MDHYIPEAIIIGLFLYLCTAEIAEAMKECWGHRAKSPEHDE